MTGAPPLPRPLELVPGRTYHRRLTRGGAGGPQNAFGYRVDYVLADMEGAVDAPWPFARARRAPVSLHDADHGGPPGQGRGAAWVREALEAAGVPQPETLLLLAQPRVLGHVFNPVSFWLGMDGAGGLRVVLPEVTNTYGDRHTYLCHRDDHAPLTPGDTLRARKLLHVSPFQDVAGGYAFAFEVTGAAVSIRIRHEAPGGAGLVATLEGPRVRATTRGLLGALIRRPFGSRRVLGLIHWQALVLWWKGAAFRPRPLPPGPGPSR
ncbi:MAG: DUF1365 domain-containing protein [Paracoccaceae bacterium]